MGGKKIKLSGGAIVAIILIIAAGTIVRAIVDKANSLPGGVMSIDVIDVGNADSILIQCDGVTMLIDAGENNDGDSIIAYIMKQGIKKLDYVIVTHPDADHIGGMDVVVNNFPIGEFIMPQMPDEILPTTKTYLDLLEALDKKGMTITQPVPGMNLTIGAATAEILAPSGSFSSTNNMSVVCKVVNGNNRFLFMGDAEKQSENVLLDSGMDLRCDFIKIGHHGSKTSTQQKLLDVVSPKYAVITCGADNNYGHPHPDVLDRLAKNGVTVFRSDINGTVTIQSDGNSITYFLQKNL